ncbi:hypothetical protein KSP39_PZI016168 [Platanthera zijinensis]|uniref:Uncharacterized protein n=1 Tax=Platanthera zijinensis TaxID=2320716 RepID=A0AAP0B6Z8_9ASPA
MAGVIARRRSAIKAAHPDQSAVAATDLRSEVSSFIHRRKRTSMGHRRLSGHRPSPFFHCKLAGAAVDSVQVIRGRDKTKEELRVAPLPMEDEIFDCIVPDILEAGARYSDLYLPLADGRNMAFGLNYGFPGQFGLSYPDEMFGSSSTESILKLGSMGSLSLDEYSTDALI